MAKGMRTLAAEITFLARAETLKDTQSRYDRGEKVLFFYVLEDSLNND